MSPLKSSAIACHQVCHYYQDGAGRRTILDHIDLSIARGEWVSIVGRSGSGKSTLLHVLAGLLKPCAGQIDWGEASAIDRRSERQCSMLRNRHIGMIYQFHHLLGGFTALENVCIPLLIRGGVSKKCVIEKATVLLEQVGLGDRLQDEIYQLSGGERQRVAIARALVTEPDCLLADEPTGNLDQRNAESVYQLLLDVTALHQMSLLLVTHDQQLAQKMHRVLTLQDGCLRAA